MVNLQNEKATGQGGFSNVVGGQAKTTKQKSALNCSDDHISKLVEEIAEVGLRLRSTSGDTQLHTLPRVLKHLGARGLNTYEGTAAGYLRLATRIKELQDEYEIASHREDVFGPDGLLHKGVARYVLIGKRQHQSRQGQLELEVRV
jgi:hypothetical protein